MTTTRQLTFAAMFIALGLLLPVVFHMIGAGAVFLPMHIPVLLAGFLTGPWTGLAVGFVTPLLSSVLTGMPPVMPPIAPVMMLELATYGLVAGFLYRGSGRNIFVSLIGAMIAGRIISGAGAAMALPLVGLGAVPVWAPFTTGLVTSWPGIAIQLVFIPAIVKAAEQTSVFGRPDAARRAG